jgi:hypothetical protein
MGIIIAAACISAMAKTAALPGAQPLIVPGITAPATARSIADFETRLRPYFEGRVRGDRSALLLAPAQTPHDVDIRQIARLWNRLSPSFKKLYKAGIQMPAGFSVYPSPGGFFEVYYTTESSSSDKVSSADTYGYGSKTSWRVRTAGANSVPDYIDEVAWALDSSHSMLVGRFGFVAPIPNIEGMFTSNKYRVVIRQIGSYDYGLTWVKDKADNGKSTGFTSFIEMRNSWAGWSKQGYDVHPEWGAQVTCVHELFHGVQYAMAWNDDIDYFPNTWLEGTAVLMEGLAFNEIKDYLQYSGAFFSNPTGMSFFDNSQSTIVYTNSLLTKYLYEKATGAPRIDFIKNMTFTNYAAVTPFHQNLRKTADSFGASWAAMLNDFHTGSYFTGSRADTSRFIVDADTLDQWNCLFDTLSYWYASVKSVSPHAMQTFRFAPSPGENDTQFIRLSGEVRIADTGMLPIWAASCILMPRTMGPDSVARILVDRTGQAMLRIDNWHSLTQTLIIVTSAHPSEKRTATVSLMPCNKVSYSAGGQRIFRITAADTKSYASVNLTAHQDLHCQLVLDSAAATAPAGAVVISGAFRIGYPSFWGADATVSIKIGVETSLIREARRNSVIPPDSIGLFCIEPASVQKISAVSSSSGDTTFWEAAPVAPGTYAVLGLVKRATGDIVSVYPNPARLSSRFMNFEGTDITGVRIYSTGGTLVCSTADAAEIISRYNGGYQWRLVNSRRSVIVPGCYIAMVTEEPSDAAAKTTLHKLMVFP